jgi:hypothetical protein
MGVQVPLESPVSQSFGHIPRSKTGYFYWHHGAESNRIKRARNPSSFFTDDMAEVQTQEVICPKSHSQVVTGLDLDLRSL